MVLGLMRYLTLKISGLRHFLKTARRFYSYFNATQARVIREFFLLQNLAPIDGNDWWHVEKFEERNRKIREGFSNNEAFCTLGYALMDVATSDSKLVINDDKPSSIQ